MCKNYLLFLDPNMTPLVCLSCAHYRFTTTHHLLKANAMVNVRVLTLSALF
jgi:hypothetical protein